MSGSLVLVKRAVGFIVGVALVVAVLALFVLFLDELFDTTLAPRGLGWIFMPISGGLAGAGLAERFITVKIAKAILKKVENSFVGNLDRQLKIHIFVVFSWFVIWPIFVWLDEPYGDYMRHDDWSNFWAVTIVPALAFIFLASMYKLFIGKNR
jgi:hypothetical protein